ESGSPPKSAPTCERVPLKALAEEVACSYLGLSIEAHTWEPAIDGPSDQSLFPSAREETIGRHPAEKGDKVRVPVRVHDSHAEPTARLEVFLLLARRFRMNDRPVHPS